MTIKFGVAILPPGVTTVRAAQVLTVEETQRAHEVLHERTGRCVTIPTVAFPFIRAAFVQRN